MTHSPGAPITELPELKTQTNQDRVDSAPYLLKKPLEKPKLQKPLCLALFFVRYSLSVIEIEWSDIYRYRYIYIYTPTHRRRRRKKDESKHELNGVNGGSDSRFIEHSPRPISPSQLFETIRGFASIRVDSLSSTSCWIRPLQAFPRLPIHSVNISLFTSSTLVYVRDFTVSSNMFVLVAWCLMVDVLYKWEVFRVVIGFGLGFWFCWIVYLLLIFCHILGFVHPFVVTCACLIYDSHSHYIYMYMYAFCTIVFGDG